jgi:hypothetical protein
VTYLEFLDALRQTPRGWCITPSGYIRQLFSECEVCCPITAVEPSHRRPTFACEVAFALGLSVDVRNAIIYAADSRYFQQNPSLSDVRRDLLDACGIQESA